MKEEQKDTVNQFNITEKKYSFNDIEYFKVNHELYGEKSEFNKKAINLSISVILSIIISYAFNDVIHAVLKSPEIQNKPKLQTNNEVRNTETKRVVDTYKNTPKSETGINNTPRIRDPEDRRRYQEIMREIEEKKEQYSKINKKQDWNEFHKLFPHTSNIYRGSTDKDVINELGKPNQTIGIDGIISWIYRDFTIEIDERRNAVTGFFIKH
jgi:hypothetical protein